MALWGKDDNLRSAGTVALNYTTKVVTGTGTTFTDNEFKVKKNSENIQEIRVA